MDINTRMLLIFYLLDLNDILNSKFKLTLLDKLKSNNIFLLN